LSDFFIEYIAQYITENSVLGHLLNIKLANMDIGITTGRSSLWFYHLTLFYDNILLGAHSDRILFHIGDILYDGSVAKTASESFYTSVLARFGILGFIFPVLHLYFLVTAILKKCLYSIIWCSIFILGNVFSSLFGGCYGQIHIVMYFLLFSAYNTTVKMNKIHNSSQINPSNYCQFNTKYIK
jgi:hypothetical protein